MIRPVLNSYLDSIIILFPNQYLPEARQLLYIVPERRLQFMKLQTKIILFCYYYMYRTFANPKFFCSLAHSRIVINDVVGNADGALLNIILQGLPP